jgi:hypothetical protein
LRSAAAIQPEDEFVHQARNGVDRESLFTSPSHTSERGSMMSAADGARFQGMTFANNNRSRSTLTFAAR